MVIAKYSASDQILFSVLQGLYFGIYFYRIKAIKGSIYRALRSTFTVSRALFIVLWDLLLPYQGLYLPYFGIYFDRIKGSIYPTTVLLFWGEGHDSLMSLESRGSSSSCPKIVYLEMMSIYRFDVFLK